MKPITRHSLTLSVIVAASVVCGCEKKTHTVDMKEFIAFKIRMRNEIYDINMRINALERVTFTNDIPPGTIRIPDGEHEGYRMLIKKKGQQ